MIINLIWAVKTWASAVFLWLQAALATKPFLSFYNEDDDIGDDGDDVDDDDDDVGDEDEDIGDDGDYIGEEDDDGDDERHNEQWQKKQRCQQKKCHLICLYKVLNFPTNRSHMHQGLLWLWKRTFSSDFCKRNSTTLGRTAYLEMV